MFGVVLLTSFFGDSPSPGATLFGALWRLALFIGVILLAYYGTRFIAKQRRGAASGARLAVLEAVAVAQGAQVCIVRAAGRHFLVGASKESVTLLAELAEEDVSAFDEAGGGDFKPVKVLEYLSRARKENRHDKSDHEK